MYDVHVQTLLRTMRHDETFLLLASIRHHTTAHSASFLLLDYRHLVPVEKQRGMKDLPSKNDTTTMADLELEEFGNDVYDADQTLRSLRIPNRTDKPIEGFV